MPDDLVDLAQQVRLLRLTVDDGGIGTGGQAVGVLAQFSRSGVVNSGPFGTVWPITALGTIAGVSLTFGTKPWRGYAIVDVFVNSVSLWSDASQRPLFGTDSTNPLVALLPVPQVVVPGDLITATVVRAAGRDFELQVVAAANASSAIPQTPTLTVAHYDEDNYDDPLALYGS